MMKWKEPPIFTKVYELQIWLAKETLLFPKSYRFTLAASIQNEGLELLKCLIAARNNLEKSQNLKRTDVQLETLKILLRIAQETKCLSFKKYEHGVKLLEEIGRLLGNWQKNI